MPVSVVPVLSLKVDQLYTPNDQIAYILRHAFYNPGWTSNYLEAHLISLQRLFAECSNDLGQMADRLHDKLEHTLRQLYNGYYTCTVQVVEDDPKTMSRRVSVSITDQRGNLVLSNRDIMIENGQLYIRSTTGEK